MLTNIHTIKESKIFIRIIISYAHNEAQYQFYKSQSYFGTSHNNIILTIVTY